MATHGQKTVPQRHEIADELKWKLEDLYATDEAWEADFQAVKNLLPELQSYEGKVTSNPETLLAVLELRDNVSRLAERLYGYAHMRRDQDTTVPLYQGMADRVQSLVTEARAAAAFIQPEILAADPATIEGWIASHPPLQLYRFDLLHMLRDRPHTLSKELESLIAQTGEMAAAPRTIFSMLIEADMKFPVVKDEDGSDIELTEGRYRRLIHSTNRDVRRGAYEALFSTYRKYNNTLAAAYSSSVKKDVFYARTRKHGSAVEMHLHPDNVPLSVYENLVATVHKHLPSLHRYLRVRKERLGVETLRMYDLYTPIVADVDRRIPWDEAKQTVAESLQPLGPRYLAALERSLNDRWIDVYENKGKSHGAYSWGVHGTHPFILMNYDDTMNNMFTLTHELGHAMHSHFSQAAQPYVYAHYTTFVAEVASTFNENLLMHHLLSKTPSGPERQYLINQWLEDFRTTVFRQTMFAEFEWIAHARAEAGESLTAEVLNGIYRELNDKYYGAVVDVDDHIEVEWSRIPHFYRPFYVYKYATGYAAATALSQQVLQEGEPAVKRYLEFLSSGGADYPLNQLRAAGVDMEQPEAVDKALTQFGELVAELEQAFA